MPEMPNRPRPFALAAALAGLGMSVALAADGAWSFDTADQGHPNLSYAQDGKTLFMVGCGHAFAVRAVYPDTSKNAGERAAITIANGRARMILRGMLESGLGDSLPPDTTYFVQTDLGYGHLDPGVYGKRWKAKESRLFEFLDSGRPLTISAEGHGYGLPPIRIRSWASRFKKIC